MRKAIMMLGVVLLLPMSVFSAEPSETVDGGREMPKLTTGASGTATATVEAIDLDNRIVILRTEDGELVRLAISEEARNLPQVEVGDRVVVKYEIGFALALAPARTGLSERIDTITLKRAPLGQKPGGMLSKAVEVTAVVRMVDLEARTVTLQGAKYTVTLRVGEDIDLASVRIGDEVDAVYQESLAISVEPAPAGDGK